MVKLPSPGSRSSSTWETVRTVLAQSRYGIRQASSAHRATSTIQRFLFLLSIDYPSPARAAAVFPILSQLLPQYKARADGLERGGVGSWREAFYFSRRSPPLRCTQRSALKQNIPAWRFTSGRDFCMQKTAVLSHFRSTPRWVKWSECNYRTWKNPVISMVCKPSTRGFIRS